MSDVIELDDLGKHFDAVGQAIEHGDFEPTLRQEVRPLVLQSIRDNFNSSAGADGSAWPARKIAGDGHPLLIESGTLMQAATGGGSGHVTEADSRELSVGVDTSAEGLAGAAAHQFGYSPNNLPARPYLEARDEALEAAGEAIADRAAQLAGEVV